MLSSAIEPLLRRIVAPVGEANHPAVQGDESVGLKVPDHGPNDLSAIARVARDGEGLIVLADTAEPNELGDRDTADATGIEQIATEASQHIPQGFPTTAPECLVGAHLLENLLGAKGGYKAPCLVRLVG